MKNKKESFSISSQHIGQWIDLHIGDLVKDTVKLVNVPSVSEETGNSDMPFGEGCLRALELALDMGRRMGFEARNHENFCGSLLWRGKSEKEIGIFGHLDVVPEGTGWQYQPYDAVVTGGMIIGRGAADNKGAALSAIYAVKYLMDSGYQPEHSIRMFLGCNEEAGMKDIEYYTEHNPMPEFSFTPDAAFPVCHGEKGVMEIDAEVEIHSEVLKKFTSGIASNAVPGDASAVLQAEAEHLKQVIPKEAAYAITDCGNGQTKIEVKGIAAHAAFPEGSESAEVKLASILLASDILDEEARRLMEGIVAVFGDYHGVGIGVPYEDEVSGKLTHVGGMARMEDGVFRQNINIRYTITANRSMMIETITKTLEKQGFVIKHVRDSAPSFVDKAEPVVQKLTAICNKHLGTKLEPYVMGGGTYARKLRNAVGYGPGIPGDDKRFGTKRGGAHQPDEYVEIQRLRKAVAIYAEAIVAIDALF